MSLQSRLTDLISVLGADMKLKLNTTDAPELVRDTMSTALISGPGVDVVPSDVGDTITLSRDSRIVDEVVLTAADTFSNSSLTASPTLVLNKHTGSGVYLVELVGWYSVNTAGSLRIALNSPAAGSSISRYVLISATEPATVAPVGAVDSTSLTTQINGPAVTNAGVNIPALFHITWRLTLTATTGNIVLTALRPGSVSGTTSILPGTRMTLTQLS